VSETEGCDCTELCSMGPTCPGGMLAELEGSGCWRTEACLCGGDGVRYTLGAEPDCPVHGFPEATR
jgi:hypothetical protein